MSQLRALLPTLAIGTVGGTVFALLSMPLAWMLGAMVFTTVAAMGGRELMVPRVLRAGMITILGVLLGSSFTPALLDQVSRWPFTLLGLGLYLSLVTGLLFLYFWRWRGFDPATAYFSATPGGLTEMVITGAAMGGDDRTIALVHGARILLVVLVIPFGFRYFTGVVTNPSSAGPSLAITHLDDLAVLAACAVVGVAVGGLLRLPAYRMVGPMLASAVVHITGITESRPPFELVAAAQVVVGSAVGARFSGVAVRRVLGTLAASFGATALMLVLTGSFAVALARLTGLDLAPIVLAYAPGGLTEMSLIALSLGVETAFVVTHHVARIVLIVTMAPLAFRLARRR
ncbi:MAG: AbrB family transcriptional regulator [Ectothiorhodospiraceae bacterium]|nr:AbrB family transcriptional regulator [Chromatiales bacterium]MCP5156332.1 AbrB family transcriptional regulator [Ectothiorhodospiraceae bacterium]